MNCSGSGVDADVDVDVVKDLRTKKASLGKLANLVAMVEPDTERRTEKSRASLNDDGGEFNARSPSPSSLLRDSSDGTEIVASGVKNGKRNRKQSYQPYGSPHTTGYRSDQIPGNSNPSLGSPQGSPRLPCRPKKHSLPSTPLLLPNVAFECTDPSVDNITKQLEETVRKISRGSPNGYSWMAHYPRHAGTPPATNNHYLSELNNKRTGLSVLARGYEQYRESLVDLRPSTEFGEASSDDLSSEWESCSESELPASNILLKINRRTSSTPYNIDQTSSQQDSSSGQRTRASGWRKLRSMVQWTPFVQTFKNRRYQWVQLAGHSGNFKAGKDPGTVLKKMCPQEEVCYNQLKDDSLNQFVPDYQGNIMIDNEKFIQLHDCLSTFHLPSIMDCKVGVRTYLEEELAKAKEKPKLRKDMYEKMMAVDPSAPTDEEHRMKGVTKPRYMVWRETISSTATLGFRIEGVKKNDGTSSKEFKTTKTREQILESFRNFVSGSIRITKQYLERLVNIRRALEESEFFKAHELIGSSLLFVHDGTKANIWLIDFGKTVIVPDGVNIDHRSPWEVGNHEDGYLIGIENLISLYSELILMLEKETNSEIASSEITLTKSNPSPPDFLQQTDNE